MQVLYMNYHLILKTILLYYVSTAGIKKVSRFWNQNNMSSSYNFPKVIKLVDEWFADSWLDNFDFRFSRWGKCAIQLSFYFNMCWPFEEHQGFENLMRKSESREERAVALRLGEPMSVFSSTTFRL